MDPGEYCTWGFCNLTNNPFEASALGGKTSSPYGKGKVYLLTEISGDRPRGLSAQGVTSDLATCSPVQDVLAQGILDKIHH